MAIKIVNRFHQPLKYSVLQMPSQPGGFTHSGVLQPGQSEEVPTPKVGGNYNVGARFPEGDGTTVQDGSTVTFGMTVT